MTFSFNKTKSLILVLILSFTISFQAQEFEFGAKAGVNLANISFSNSDYSTKPIIGFHIVAFGTYSIDEKLAIQPELLFTTGGNKWTFDGNLDGKITSSYISIPVLLQYKVSDAFYVEAGPQYNFLLSIKQSIEDGDNEDIKEFYKTVTIGIGIGIGYDLETVAPGLKANLRYSTDLSKMNDEEVGGNDLVYYDLKASNGQGIVVHVILEDKNGHIWIGYGGGIAKYDGTYFTNYYEKNILVNSGLWSMAMDRNGLLWIGTIYGVYTFDGNAFQPFEIPEGKVDTGKGISASKMIHCIIEDSKGHMWFATNGGAYRYDGNILTIFSEKEGLNSYFVNSIIEDKNGQYWFSTADNGLFRFDGTSFTNILKNTEIEGKGVGDIIEDRNGNIWFELKNFGVYSYDGKTLTNYPKEEGMSFEIYEDLLGRLWFVGFKGAYRMDGNSFVNVNRNGPW